MHPLPEYPHTAAFGVTRAVAVNTQMIALENGQLNRRKNPQWASVKGTPMDASRSGAAGTRLAALGRASRSVPVTCAVSGRWSAKILNERKLSVTPCHVGENAPRGRHPCPARQVSKAGGSTTPMLANRLGCYLPSRTPESILRGGGPRTS
jgi:hypothetical protein